MTQLPHGILEDLAADIGYTATCALVDWFGGCSIYVPESADPEHRIAGLIGLPAFRRLAAFYGSTTINLPRDARRDITRRDRMIGALICAGVSVHLIAERAMLSERQVVNVRRKLEDLRLIPVVLHPGAGGHEATGKIPGHPDSAEQLPFAL